MKIYKYTQSELSMIHRMPGYQRVLSAMYQDENLVFWVEVDELEVETNVEMRVFLTGDTVPLYSEHVATLQHPTLGLIFHLYRIY